MVAWIAQELSRNLTGERSRGDPGTDCNRGVLRCKLSAQASLSDPRHDHTLGAL